MKLVIDIPEETYKGVLELWETEKDRRFKNVVHKAIVNGIPYEERPKGEWEWVQYDANPNIGLISRSALLKAMEEERRFLLARGQTVEEHILVHHCLPIIDKAPTVCNDNYAMGYQDGVKKVLSENDKHNSV